MKNKKKIAIIIGIFLVAVCLLLIVLKKEDDEKNKAVSLQDVKETFESDINELKNGKYKNLVSIDFESSIEAVDGIYNIEIQIDNSAEEGSLLDSFNVRKEVIDKFFQEDFDKSFLVTKVYLTEETIEEISYTETEMKLIEGKYDNAVGIGSVIGNATDEGGYMVQVSYNRLHTWLSKYGFNTIHPSSLDEYKEIYPYLMGDRVDEDTVLQLKDGKIYLSELEEIVLDYMNSDKFPLVKADGISFAIGEARVIQVKDYEGVCFLARRVYKGIPFEYGANIYTEEYNDKLGHDGGEISYIESTSPDTMLGFFRTDGTVIEEKEISQMMTAGDALSLLSDSIGENSVYEVHGVELVYRNCEISEDKVDTIGDILEPKWKIITINQNDDKYTLFYVDVVTGEITNRFEYYYD